VVAQRIYLDHQRHRYGRFRPRARWCMTTRSDRRRTPRPRPCLVAGAS
jgi:hypothetical protein